MLPLLASTIFLILNSFQSGICNSVAITTISNILENKKRLLLKATGVSESLLEKGSLTSTHCRVEPANLWRETLERNKRILEGSLRKGDWDWWCKAGRGVRGMGCSFRCLSGGAAMVGVYAGVYWLCVFMHPSGCGERDLQLRPSTPWTSYLFSAALFTWWRTGQNHLWSLR